MSSAEKTRNNDVIEIGQHFYIRASSSLADDRTRVLLHDDTFGIFDRSGDIQPVGFGQQGIFFAESRHLSRLEMRINGERPLLLSSTIRDDNVLFAVDLTNPDLDLASGPLARGTLHIYRTKFLAEAICYDKIAVHNYSDRAAAIELSFEFGADFADIFEIRGEKRAQRGKLLPVRSNSTGVRLAYEGLDGIRRSTNIRCSRPTEHDDGGIRLRLRLEPQTESSFTLNIQCRQDGDTGQKKSGAEPENYDSALHRLAHDRKTGPLSNFQIETSNEQFNAWLRRSQSDLEMMICSTPHGLYPYAGVPWFSTVFGRDGIITALELLWLEPDVARGVLSYLAASQATEADPERDAEPGKILHETRRGEMASLGEVPFGCYYGTVDATPLFVMLAAAYYRRTADLEFLRSIWPNIQAALDWIDHYGDRDGDGFVEYQRKTENGLVQQGWKDSGDSISYSDGGLAQAPIALCEVQSYVYAAKSGIAEVAADLGQAGTAEALRKQAVQLRDKFREAFWCDDLSTFALALDGEKRQCRVHSSNAGHCLFSGIATAEQSRAVSEALLSEKLFSGWGVRTLATGEKRYNPMSYHNGSVWPHDNAVIAMGGMAPSYKELPLRILSGLLELSAKVNLHRLPELICGFAQRPGKGPTLYPVACSPQAWAAGAVFLALQSCLGIDIATRESRIVLRYAALPEAIRRVQIRNLKIGNACVDLLFECNRESVGVDILRRSGDVEIVSLR